MFICKITGKCSKHNEKCNRVIVKSREKIYTKKFKNEETGKFEDVEIGRGREPLVEVNMSAEGLQMWNIWSADEREAFIQHLV